MDISAKMVKELRDRTAAGMMDCKKALKEANGDSAEAEKILRKASTVERLEDLSGLWNLPESRAPESRPGEGESS